MAIIDHKAAGRHTTPLDSADHDPNSPECDGRNDPVLIHEPGASDPHRGESVRATNGDARQAAAALWQELAAAGMPLTGAQLAEHFGRSARWGRDVIASCRTVPAVLRPTAVGSERQEDGSSQAAAASAIVCRLTALAVVVVAAVAAAASYSHMRRLAVDAGEGGIAFLLPLSVDGLVVAASMSMLVQRRAGHPAGRLAWGALLLGVGASLAANVAAAEPTLVGRLVAAWPPLALLLAYELLMQQVGIHACR